MPTGVDFDVPVIPADALWDAYILLALDRSGVRSGERFEQDFVSCERLSGDSILLSRRLDARGTPPPSPSLKGKGEGRHSLRRQLQDV
jgi:hypothetical protein